MRLATSEELPVHLGGAKFQPQAEIATLLRLAIDHFGSHVKTARQRGDADPIILLPKAPGFHPGTVRADVHCYRLLKNTTKIAGQKPHRNLNPIALFYSSSFFHVHIGPRKLALLRKFSVAGFVDWAGLSSLLPFAFILVHSLVGLQHKSTERERMFRVKARSTDAE
jgi:hypothetical protein